MRGIGLLNLNLSLNLLYNESKTACTTVLILSDYPARTACFQLFYLFSTLLHFVSEILQTLERFDFSKQFRLKMKQLSVGATQNI